VKFVKIGAKVAAHGRSVASPMDQFAIPKNLFAGVPRPIVKPRSPPGPATA